MESLALKCEPQTSGLIDADQVEDVAVVKQQQQTSSTLDDSGLSGFLGATDSSFCTNLHNSDESPCSWMKNIDVSGFQRLTSQIPPSSPLSSHSPLVYTPLSEPSPHQNGVLTSGGVDPATVDHNAPLQQQFCGGGVAVGGGVNGLLHTKAFPKPAYSYSCLIALALKNSRNGRLQVSEIYNFMCENFPYFRTAPAGWKNSVRHNLSLNKCFEKIELETPGHGRKACLWTMNQNKIAKMNQEVIKWRQKDPSGVIDSLANPNDLELIEKGLKGVQCETLPYFYDQLPDIVQHAKMNGSTAALPVLSYHGASAPTMHPFTLLSESSNSPRYHSPMPTSLDCCMTPPHLRCGSQGQASPALPVYSGSPGGSWLTMSPILPPAALCPAQQTSPFKEAPYTLQLLGNSTISEGNNNSLLQSALYRSPCRPLTARILDTQQSSPISHHHHSYAAAAAAPIMQRYMTM